MSEKNGGLAGMVGSAVFAFVVVVLTVLQYDFMVGIGWSPVGVSDVPWPSSLALGPYGWLQSLNFLLFGLMLIAFAGGLQRGISVGGRFSRVGPILLIVAGIALLFLAFKTDPPTSTNTYTWHGAIHLLAFIVMGVSFLLSLLFLWRRMARDPRWRGYGPYSLASVGVGLILIFIPAQLAVYFFFAVLLAWVEVVAIHLRSVAEGMESQHAPRVR